MCGEDIIRMGLTVGMTANMAINDLMESRRIDEVRFRTLNHFGVADKQHIVTSEQFLEWGRLHAKHLKASGSQPSPRHDTLLEIGGGFGFLAARAVNQGINYIYNDLCSEHGDIAESQFEESNYDIAICAVPHQGAQLRSSIHTGRRVIGIGAFSVLHFLTAKEVEDFLSLTYEILEPGGRAFFTFGSPYNRLFKLFPYTHNIAKKRFLADPLNHRFPGEIPNAHRYFYPRGIPEGTVAQYPDFFNAMDPETFSYLVNKDPERPFKIISAEYIRRPHPPEQAVSLAFGAVGELVGVVLEKPGVLEPPLPPQRPHWLTQLSSW